MTRRLTFILVTTLGILAGAVFIAWGGSYAEGFFWVNMSRSAGTEFITIQRGTLAFGIEGSGVGFPARQYFWWLEPDDMFDKCGEQTMEGIVYRLPAKGSFNLALGSNQYPWRWQFVGLSEGFIPLWFLALCLGIIPGLWAFGLFDKADPPPPPALPQKSVLPSEAEGH